MLLSLAEVAPHSLVESVDITQSGVTPTFMHICVLLASPTCLLYKMEMVGQRAYTVARAINRECMCDGNVICRDHSCKRESCGPISSNRLH